MEVLVAPVIKSCSETVLVRDGDDALPIEDHVLLSEEVIQVESLRIVTKPQLPHFQTEPPGSNLGEVNLDLLEDVEQVGGEGEEDRVQRHLNIAP